MVRSVHSIRFHRLSAAAIGAAQLLADPTERTGTLLSESRKIFRIPENAYDERIYGHFGLTPPAFCKSSFEFKPTIYTPIVDFYKHFRLQLAAAKNIRVIYHATATRIKLNDARSFYKPRIRIPLQDVFGLLYRKNLRYFPKFHLSEAAQRTHRILNGTMHCVSNTIHRRPTRYVISYWRCGGAAYPRMRYGKRCACYRICRRRAESHTDVTRGACLPTSGPRKLSFRFTSNKRRIRTPESCCRRTGARSASTAPRSNGDSGNSNNAPFRFSAN